MKDSANQSRNTSTPIIFVVGATATGKSQQALKLSQQFGGVIVNGDSIQLFQSVNIGAAKPSLQEQSLVPHLLFDIVPEGEEFTAGKYRRVFYELLSDYIDHPSVPFFVVGGSGFYFQAIEKGMYPVVEGEQLLKQKWTDFLLQNGGEKLFDCLLERDLEASQKISKNDTYRVIRALTLIESHGCTLAKVEALFKQSADQSRLANPLLKIGFRWPKQELLKRVSLRVDQMLKSGLVDEVEALLKKGLEMWSPLNSVGYAETVEFLKKPSTLVDLKSMIVQNTMKLAKKQRTWFQRDKQIIWFDGVELEKNTGPQPDHYVKEFLLGVSQNKS